MALIDLAATLAGTSSVSSAATVTYSAVATLAGTSAVSSAAVVSYSAAATLAGTSSGSAAMLVTTGFAAPVVLSPPARTVSANRMILDQVDLFLGDGITRAQDVVVGDLQLRVFRNSSQQDWTLVTGVGVTDVQVTSGKVYWTELSAGFYNVRFYPNAIGLWRVLVTYPTHNQAVSLSYDVVPKSSIVGSIGIRTSFFKV